MATRLKTIKFAWPFYTADVTDATLVSLGSKTIYIPENSVSNPVSFVSVFVEVSFHDTSTTAGTGGTIGEHRVAVTLAGATATTFTETDDIANSGENLGGVVGPIDFTSHFTSNWGSGTTSKGCTLEVFFDVTTGSAPTVVRNVSAIITITYTYNDTESTHIKTVYIPLESRNSALATSATEIGTNQIPALDSFLPEASVTVRDYFFILEGNENNASTTDITVDTRIDVGGSTQTTGAFERASASDVFNRIVWDLSAAVPATNSTHAFYCWANVASFNNLVITLVVTYEFAPGTTTTVLNSVFIPVEMASPLGLDSTGASRFQRDFFIEEPTTITLVQSSYRLNYNVAAAVTGLNVRVGSQSYRSYTDNGAVACGMFSLQQRIDSGGAQGAGVTLARGKCTLTIDAYRTDTTDDPTNINGYVILNYTSGVATDGVAAHHHHVEIMLRQWDGLAFDRLVVSSFSVAIPETNYRITSIGIIIIMWDAVAANSISMDVAVLATEGKGAGWLDVYSDAKQTDAERGCTIVYTSARDVFDRFPSDAGDRLDVESARDYRLFYSSAAAAGLIIFLDYHSIYRTVTVTITNYSSDGSGISVDIFRSDNDELVRTVSTSAGGTATFSWYDNVTEIYGVARQSSTLYARSENSTGNITINLKQPGVVYHPGMTGGING